VTPAEVAAEVLRRITEHPETYDQRRWLTNPRTEIDPDIQPHETVDDWSRCGTVACVAGHAAHAAVTARGEPIRPEDIRSDAISSEDIRRAATAALGLDNDRAGWLFWHGRKKSDVVDMLTAIADSGELADAAHD